VTRTIEERAVLGYSLAFSAGGVAASWALISPRFAGSLALGAALETLNFRALFGYWRRALLGGERAGWTRFASFGLRLLVLAAAIWAALALGAHPVGLVVGLSLMVPAVVLAAWRARPAPDPEAEALAPDDPGWDAWDPWRVREREPSDGEDQPRTCSPTSSTRRACPG
jgi:hypothetical protein